ncbi:MAG: hypothetical protein H7A38_04855 [Chlamydiales bacterium]|nr:hypothetical protein [Chlamydiales bacterium]
MGTILRSTWEGWGSVIFAKGLDATPFRRPLFLDAFVYGTTVHFSQRLIEGWEPKDFPVVAGIAFRILFPYLMRSLLHKGLAVSIPSSFIHLENGIYLLALLDGETPYGHRHYLPYRFGANVIHSFGERYRSLFD